MTQPTEQTVYRRDFWEHRYDGPATMWSGRPNASLVTEADQLAPTTALDAGCGEGGDALWLASRGATVTAVDVADSALRRAEQQIARRVASGEIDAAVAQRITWRRVDLLAPFDLGTFDLVTAHYVHLPWDERERTALLDGLTGSVAVGGTLLLVGHHPRDLPAGSDARESPAWMFTAAEAAALLDPDRWELVTVQDRSRDGLDRSGKPGVRWDSVLRARRAH